MTSDTESTEKYDLDVKICRHYLWRMITPGQCRAARAFLQVAQDELAKAASVGVSTIRDFEVGKRTPMVNNLKAIRAELERRGVRFVDQDDSGTCGVLYTEPDKGIAG